MDEHSDTRALTVQIRLFGEQGGELQFSHLGVPTRIARNDKSAVGAFVDAIGGVPAAVVSGLDSGVKIATALDSLRDARDEREPASLKRRINLRQKEPELKGLEATAEDFAELKRLEQQVAMGEAQGKLAVPPALAAIQAERDMVKTQQELEAARRDLALDAELAAARAQIARLQAEVDAAELRKKSREEV